MSMRVIELVLTVVRDTKVEHYNPKDSGVPHKPIEELHHLQAVDQSYKALAHMYTMTISREQ